MVITKGDPEIAEECVKIARTLPDYFTDSGVINLVQDVKSTRYSLQSIPEE
jgi:hypothetical protein